MTDSLQHELGELGPGLQRSSSVTSSRSSRSAALSRAESLVAGGCTPDDTAAGGMAAVCGGELPASGSLAELRQQQIVRDLAARRQQLAKRGSILSNYMIGMPNAGRRLDLHNDLDSDIEMDDEDDIEFDDDDDVASHVSHVSSSLAAYSDRDYDVEHSGGVLQLRKPTRRRGVACDSSDVTNCYDVRAGVRQQPVGANSSIDTESVVAGIEDADVDSSAPERLFKVVFVGDSSVGKSSFIYRFCNSVFKPSYQATIGVDFQVKNIRVDNHVIALQLWDTAGQERYRSITKQYFRKADGVLVMYDVTAEQSFRNLRNWMTSVQDGTEPGTVLLMVGNKLDMVDDDTPQLISTKDGSRLADEFGALFFETSAKSGLGVKDSIDAMARLLREREDIEMEKALQLSVVSTQPKRGCCSRPT